MSKRTDRRQVLFSLGGVLLATGCGNLASTLLDGGADADGSAPPDHPDADAGAPPDHGDAGLAGTDGGLGFAPQAGISVSGTFAENNSVTITRAAGGFGTKPHDPRPLLWMPMTSSAMPSSLGRVTTGRPVQGLTYSPSGGADGAGCYTGTGVDAAGDNVWTVRLDSDEWAGSTYHWNTYDQKIRISRRVRKNFGDLPESANYNVKDTRIWGRSAGGGIQAPNCYFSRSNGRFGEEGLNPGGTPGSPYIDFDYNESLRTASNSIQNRWYDEELVMKTNSAAMSSGPTSDGEYKMAVNGGDYLFKSPWHTYQDWGLRWRNASGDANDGNMRVMFPIHYVVDAGNGVRPVAPAGSVYQTDDLYVDDSWAWVVFGDSSSYAACTYRRPFPASAWSDTAVSVVVQAGGINLSGKHVFVVTNDDVPIYVGQIR
jgi:hypothetical protein